FGALSLPGAPMGTSSSSISFDGVDAADLPWTGMSSGTAAAMVGMGSYPGGTPSGFLPEPPSIEPGAVPGGRSTALPGVDLMTGPYASSVAPKDQGYFAQGTIAGPIFDPNASGGAKAASAVGAAGAVFAGTMGVIGGIKQGGARGAATAIGAAAGTAALFDPEPISKAVLMGVALASSVVTTLGDPKKNFQNKQDKLLRENHNFGPEALSISSDTSGQVSSYGFKGNVRSSDYSAYSFDVTQGGFDHEHGQYNQTPSRVTPNYGPPVQVTQHFDFLDPAGIQAHADNIATSVQGALQRGHPLNDTIATAGK
ncbi:MAG TPA: hypothetical protein VNH18_15155, partial [Bryobacteraceae bacterium]|nr:hypothetical protein [Bryobacteraceae bacterium]